MGQKSVVSGIPGCGYSYLGSLKTRAKRHPSLQDILLRIHPAQGSTAGALLLAVGCPWLCAHREKSVTLAGMGTHCAIQTGV